MTAKPKSQHERRFLRLPEVMHLTGLSRSTLYLRAARGTFPPPIKLGNRAVGWDSAAVEQWIEQRIKETQPPED